MEKIVLWGKEIEKDFAGATEEQLDDFLELMHFIQKNNIWNAICETTLDKEELWE